MEENYKVSVIIPIYKVEPFIKRCANSLFGQTLNDVEYIFVDDASPDNSIAILKEVITLYPDRREQIRIVHHDVNKGLPAARNTGLALAKGVYVFHCDSDDFVEPTMLEKLYAMATKEVADYVWSDWFLSYEQTDRYMHQPRYATSEEALKGIMAGEMKYNVWNKLVKRSLYVENGISFPAGHSMGEDMTMIMLLACAERVAYVPEAFYHYVKTNAEAMTQIMSEKHLADIKYNVDRIVGFIELKKGKSWDKEIGLFKLNVKLPFLISADKQQYQTWKAWYPESNQYILGNKKWPLRTRVLQWMADKGQWWYVSLYFLVGYRIIYRLKYQ